MFVRGVYNRVFAGLESRHWLHFSSYIYLFICLKYNVCHLRLNIARYVKRNVIIGATFMLNVLHNFQQCYNYGILR